MPEFDPMFKPLTFYNLTVALALYNQHRLLPGVVVEPHAQEIDYIEGIRRSVDMPPKATMAWYESLLKTGPGQGDPLFDWLAHQATEEQMVWFLRQEAAGEAGFGDLVAMTQVRMPAQAQLEMARNYWDEMGQGKADGMHGQLLSRILAYFKAEPPPVQSTVPESLLLNNMLTAFAVHRRYAYLSVGALGAIEMTAPGRVALVDQGLRRLGVPKKDRQYFTVHATLDVAHAREWNKEIVRPLSSNPVIMQQIAEGAYLRLWAGERCFARYRAELGVDDSV